MKKLAFIFATIFISSLCYAQVPESFLGKWEGSGTLYNSDATFSMEWEQVLNGKFYRLNFTNALDNGTFSMNAHGYYEVEADSVNGYWFDSRGVSFPLTGVIEDQVLTIQWGAADFEQGKTVYSLLTSNEIRVTDFVLRKGEYVQFGTATYQQKKE